jgi:hypothetical protein
MTNTTTKKTQFYKFTAAELPDSLFRPEASANDWVGCDDENDGNKDSHEKRPWMETTCDSEGFPQGNLSRVVPLEPLVDLERCIGIPMYMIANVSPILVPLALLVWKAFRIEYAKHLAVGVVVYHASLYTTWRLFLVPIFEKRYHVCYDLKPKDHFFSQYIFTERNVTKYCSISYVWPSSLQRPALAKAPNADRSVIFCLIPHGLCPYGVVGYPYWSKIWNSKLCSWTCAPILLKLPGVSYYLRAFGYIPAKSKDILKALTQQDRNVGIVLDGIDGMFESNPNDNNEVGTILDRKGICKIALKANAALVPVYGFGHTTIYNVVVDPFGILKWLSSKLHMSLVPFFGRWGWFMGPPKRTAPISLCLGDPILPPPKADNNSTDTTTITQQDVDDHHARLLEGFRSVFETHKRGYYGDAIGSKKQLVFCR